MDWKKLQDSLEYVPRPLVWNTAPKLDWTKVGEIRDKYAVGDVSMNDLAKVYGVNKSTILRIVRHEIW